MLYERFLDICRASNDEAVDYIVEDLEQESIDVNGIPSHAASARTLYATKKDTVRPQDRADADRLRRKFRLD